MTTETTLSPEILARIDEAVAERFAEVIEKQVAELTAARTAQAPM